MNSILRLQAISVSFDDAEGPLSNQACPTRGSQITINCSTSSNGCDIAGMGEFYF